MKEDFWTFVVCALVTMIVGTQVGLLTGIVMSFVTMMIGRFIQRSSVKSWILGIEMETEDIVPISVVSDVTVIDDYAHHPTEIKVTLEAARQKYPNKKLVAVFKPNTYSRTERYRTMRY